jgi:cysteine desulfurase
MKFPIYMDHQATTPVDYRVLEVMIPYFTEIYGNAASIDHEYGNKALQAVEDVRRKIALIINCSPEEIIFTSGATESDNLAILGVANQYESKGCHIITCVTEHKAVLDTCSYLEKHGWAITYIPVDHEGLVNLDDVRKAINADTKMISIMTANNEIGVVAPISEIGKIAHNAGVIFHTDATQAIGYLPMDVQDMNIDLLSLSGHKVYGPKGIGALYVRKHHPRVKLIEQMHGGGHEGGMRSGTLNVPGIIGFGKAMEICQKEMKSETKRLRYLRDVLWNGIQSKIDGVTINGDYAKRLPHNLSIAISGIESRALLTRVKNHLAISSGSACTTSKVEPSYVIYSLYHDEKIAHSTLRFGLGRFTTLEEVEYAIDILTKTVIELRNLR